MKKQNKLILVQQNKLIKVRHKWPGGVTGLEWKRQLDEAFENNDTTFLLKHQVRQVRWLYANHNKMLMVYDEKMVRMMIQKLEQQIVELVSTINQLTNGKTRKI